MCESDRWNYVCEVKRLKSFSFLAVGMMAFFRSNVPTLVLLFKRSLVKAWLGGQQTRHATHYLKIVYMNFSVEIENLYMK